LKRLQKLNSHFLQVAVRDLEFWNYQN